ncbi:Non-catalytic module family EXPN protein [Dendrothele bispora CBS 962.96]|uniref:Non-catalytic module family EXPN protein n=1 Tax=Dendrothele bispora (strain CBS 962.96) TaxID=1314807 RepID=A0A4S8KSC2_DENBC|nr:Non-catalytic module family EXPN protein [Dendrothele bispora CBS 962.96]
MAFRILATLALVATTLAAPTSSNETSTLEKRIDHFGDATWFHVGQGNCGVFSVDSDKIVAIPKSLYDQNNGGNCFQWVRITDQRNGNVHWGQTLDSCPSCVDGLDLSPSLFEEFGSLDVGRFPIVWSFEPFGFVPPN